ncbi:hypothetical protein dsx2_2390 [Desulfovibrio sp. X2]|uniref:hypothetical protein n=1 Tax=Desulfovibrio sp. X2 TaxID=941449 RepID=UPI000358D77D|nr:hypothetical protein [Desulfovibrio sp. X2]EPR43413.1 hypothetical protein dsx2_2390 [Desulfovibrio sp. X2]
MPALLVVTDLQQPPEAYPRFFELLKTHAYARLTPAIWAVEVDATPKSLFDDLKPLIKETDFLYVFRLTPSFVGRGSANVLKWLKDHVRA